jgi:transglutaminase-like putative cysteine protease
VVQVIGVAGFGDGMGMRRGWSGLAAAAVVAGVSCAPASASWFSKGQPVPEWGAQAAKTETPAYVKDASSVVLFDEYVETIDASGRATERHRKAIRILKPQGRENSCLVAYDVDEKVNYFRAWTIAADNKNTYQAQDTDFAEVGLSGDSVMLSTAKMRVAHPPAIDVGAVVVCESEELVRPYQQEKTWFFQDDVPIVSEALEIDLLAGGKHSESWHRHEPQKPTEPAPNHFRWEMKDVQALTLRGVPSHPDWWALASRMCVQWGDAALDGKDQQWQAIGQWMTTLEAGRPDPSPEITARTKELIAGAPDFYTKVSRITESIQKDIRYFIVERGIGGLQANHAADIFRNRYGDCKDKTTLLISMLQVAGIHAAYVAVDHRRGVVDPDNPSIYGDHMITAIEIPKDVQDPRLEAVVTAKGGKRWLIFDPTNERVPAGTLPSNEQGGYGILCAGSESQVIGLPVLRPDASGSEHKGAFTLGADGTLNGQVDVVRSGAEGARMRNGLKGTDEKERRQSLEKALASDIPGVVLNSVEYVQPPALDEPSEVHYKLTASQYAHSAGTLLLVRPRVLGSYTMPFDDKPRQVPIDLDATGRWHDSYDITLPEGYVVDETPDPVSMDADFASYHSTVTAKGNTLHYEREYVVRQVEIPAEKATEFRKLESVILMDEKGTAVLKKAVK